MKTHLLEFKIEFNFSALYPMTTETNVDISENFIRQTTPEILDILLIDRSLSTRAKPRNIIWANNNYIQHDPIQYAPTAQIKAELITGEMGSLIMPRALKTMAQQKERTKTKAEVFTPTWIVKIQNDEIEKNYLNDDLETYIDRTWLEITCGEAPYMATRYDMETGELIALNERVGFIDRKMQRINQEAKNKSQWQKLAERAYQASYGFEWNGDSLLLARENLLYSYRDYYLAKWQDEPPYKHFKKMATIISYNLFQMNGLNGQIPLSQEIEQEKSHNEQLDLFPQAQSKTEKIQYAKVMNWETKKMEDFHKE